MACNLTSGFTLGCRDSVGGLKEVYIAEFDSITYGSVTSGVISTETGDFFKYELPAQTAQFTETFTGSIENQTGFYSTELVIVLPKLTASVRNELKLLAQNKCAIIAVDRNGNKWILGYENGCYMTTGTSTSGTAMGDLNGMTLTFTALETSPAYSYSGSISVA